jgi:DNA polymerase-3 subunit epsilon
MMRRNLFWLFAAASIGFTVLVVCSLAFLFWQQLPGNEKAFLLQLARQYMGYLFSAAVLLLAGLGFALDWVFRLYILPIDRIAEETRLIHSVNPAHRIQLEGGRDIVRLAEAVNQGADRYEELYHRVRDRIQQATAESEEEKNILAAIIEELPEGVLICNTEGQILLYNKRAKDFLSGDSENNHADEAELMHGHFIGLGRSIFGLIDKHLVVHALDEIADKLKREEPDVAAYFVITGKDERLLRVEAVPILTHRKDFTGFILIFYDITQQLDDDSRMDFLLRSLARATRSSLASIRAAIEAILEYPAMQSDQLQKFKEIIHKESINIGDKINETTSVYSKRLRTRWPLVRMSAQDLLDTVAKRGREKLGIHIRLEACETDCWIHVDSYSLLSAILFIQGQLKDATGCLELRCELKRNGRFVSLDFIWPGQPIRMEMLRRWEEQIVRIKDEVLPSTLKEVILHHDMEIWSHAHDKGKSAYLRLLFPTVEAPDQEPVRKLTILPVSRPEFFDFDLFNQPDQRPELDNRRLTELTYTVFDTETTGLNPREGDEIISIGAIRIVNGRLLREEFFDQLVNPLRDVPVESTAVHGIHQDMLVDQLTITRVLPMFHRFSEETILVAHNAAFDMRMLQLKEHATGVTFTNPVLDTMLLSAVVQPGHKDHDMEGIARRLGVSIVGRHTALGDAIATGEIFLKLIPLLEQQGIRTLKQARAASRKTYYSRLKY